MNRAIPGQLTLLTQFPGWEGEAKIPGHGADVALRDNGRLADIAPHPRDFAAASTEREMTGQRC